ncbi:MAG TPA: apolipoprotein N-acyltransferase, partial [Planctomycetota bacterium]|nr:apolipoprotein N-acyltransferase [Planctomycetota bacterium]
MPFRIAVLPFVFALLFWSAFHPVNAGPLGWVCLIPLLVYARRTSGVRSFLLAWAGGAAAFTACFWWVRHTVLPGPPLLGIYNGLYVALFVLIIRRLGAAWAGAVWPALEFVRGHLFSGLPWFNLGYTQERAFHLIQIADLGGVWLVSALVAFVNGALVDGRRAVRWPAAAAVAAAWIYGMVRVPMIEETPGPRIAVVQPNIPQDLKLLTQERPQQAVDNFRRHVELTKEAAASAPDLVCWPEAAIYRGIAWDAAAQAFLRTSWYDRVLAAGQAAGAPLVIGLLVTDLEAHGERFTNSALLVDPADGVKARFDKVHLVPFAELIPVESVTKPIIRAVSDLRLESMRPGAGFPVWEVAGTRFGI